MAATESTNINRQYSESPTGVEAVNSLHHQHQHHTRKAMDTSMSKSQPGTPQGPLKQRLSSAFVKDSSIAGACLSPFSRAGATGVASTMLSPYSASAGEKKRLSSSRRNSLPTGGITMDNSGSSSNNDSRDREFQSQRRLMATDLMGDNANNATMVLLMRQRVEKELKERQNTHGDKASILEALKKINMFVQDEENNEQVPYAEEEVVVEEEEEEGVTVEEDEELDSHPRPQFDRKSSNRRFAAAKQIKLSDVLSNMNSGSNHGKKGDDDNDDDDDDCDDENCSQIFSPIGKDTMQRLTSTPSGSGCGDLSKYIKMSMSFPAPREDSDVRSEAGSVSRRRSVTDSKKKRETLVKNKHSQSMSSFSYTHSIESHVGDVDVDSEDDQDIDDPLSSTGLSSSVSHADDHLDIDIDEDLESSGDEETTIKRTSSRAIQAVEPKPLSTPATKPKGILKRSSTVGSTIPTESPNSSMSQSLHEATPTRTLLHSLYDGGKVMSTRAMEVDPATPQRTKKESAAVGASPSSTPTKRRSRTGQLNRTPSNRRTAMGDKSMSDRSQTSSRRLKRGEDSSSRRLSSEKNKASSSSHDNGESKPPRTPNKSKVSDDKCATPKGEEKAKFKSTGSPRNRLKTSSIEQPLSEPSPKPERGRSGKDSEEKKMGRARSRSRNRDPRAIKRPGADTDEKEKKSRTRSRSRNRDSRVKRAPRPSQNKELAPSAAIRTMSDHSELSRGPRRSRQKGSLRKTVSDRHGMKNEPSAIIHKEDTVAGARELGNDSFLQFDPSQRSHVSFLANSDSVHVDDGTTEPERNACTAAGEEMGTGKDAKEEKAKKSKSRGSIMKLPWMGKKSSG